MSCCCEAFPFSRLRGEEERSRATGSRDDERLSAVREGRARSEVPPSTLLRTGSGRMRARDIRVASQAGFACPHPSPLPQAGEGAKSRMC